MRLIIKIRPRSGSDGGRETYGVTDGICRGAAKAVGGK